MKTRNPTFIIRFCKVPDTPSSSHSALSPSSAPCLLASPPTPRVILCLSTARQSLLDFSDLNLSTLQLSLGYGACVCALGVSDTLRDKEEGGRHGVWGSLFLVARPRELCAWEFKNRSLEITGCLTAPLWEVLPGNELLVQKTP